MDKTIMNIIKIWKKTCDIKEPVRFKYEIQSNEIVLMIFVSESSTKKMIGDKCFYREHFKHILSRKLRHSVFIEFINVNHLWA